MAVCVFSSLLTALCVGLYGKYTDADLVNKMKNVSKTVKLNFDPSREDDGVQYQCAAVLNLEQHRRQVVVTSQPITITVHSAGQPSPISVQGAIALVLLSTVVCFECWIYFHYAHMGRATS